MNTKVAFLGNMNNNHFAMARYLRDRGVDADVLLFSNEQGHFHPSADTYDLNYQAYCKNLSWGDRDTSPLQIARDLNPYKIIVGCGLAPAVCHVIGRSLDIFAPYGDDIWSRTAYPRLSSLSRTFLSRWKSARVQRAGIARCSVIHMTPCDFMYENRLTELSQGAERWLEGLPMVYTPTYNRETVLGYANRTHWAHEFRKIRDENEFVVLNHARHVWTREDVDPNDKATDNLLHGWALFKKRNPLLRAVLVTLEYGPDVEKSKRLIEDLGVGASVRFLPAMLRKDLMVGVALSDMVCGEFRYSWVGSGVLYEALAMAKPILAYRDDEMYQKMNVELYPILNARSSEGIASRLSEYCGSRERYIEQGEFGRLWYERVVVKPAVERYLAYIEKH